MPMHSDKLLSVHHRPTLSDGVFLGFLAVVLVAVAAAGRMIYVDGLKNEIYKKCTPWFSFASLAAGCTACSTRSSWSE
jgi:hypothetical protein